MDAAHGAARLTDSAFVRLEVLWLMSGLAVFLALTIVCASYATRVAAERNRSSRFWLWLSALFGPVALAVLIVLPARQAQPRIIP